MNLHYEIVGDAPVDIVVEGGLYTCLAEYRPLAKRLALGHGVLLYERAGAGTSEASPNPRTPRSIALELRDLLATLPCAEKLLLIGHSQGGLYVQQFARLFPNMTRGLVLLDPLSASDNRFKTELTPDEYKQGGVDKFANLGTIQTLLRLHMGFAVKAMMKNAPPMYYYDFPPEDKAYILSAMTRPTACETAQAEYSLAHDETLLAPLRDPEGFPDVPLALITHSSELAEKEIMEFGQASAQTAEKVESLWQALMRECMTLSENAWSMRADKSTHSIHLMQPEIVVRAAEYIFHPRGHYAASSTK